MTTEKMLEKVNFIIKMCDNSEYRKELDFLAERPEVKNEFTFAGCLDALRKDLIEQITHEEAKRNGRGNAQKIAERIIKDFGWNRPGFGAWDDVNGRQIIIDSAHAVRLVEHLKLSEAKEEAKLPSVSKIFENAEQNRGEPLELPKLSELKAKIKVDKANNKHIKKYRPFYDFGEDQPRVDAEYLAEMLELLGESEARPAANSPKVNVIYFTGEKGDGVLMPVHKR